MIKNTFNLKLALLVFALTLLTANNAYSGDIFNLIISGEQDSLVLGKIKAKHHDNEITLEVHNVVSGKDPGDTIDVRITLQETEIQEEDNVLLSLKEREDDKDIPFQTKWGIFQVTDTDPEKLEVKDGPHLFGNHNIALQVFLNSKGEIDDFYFMGDELHIRDNETTYEIYPGFDPDTPYPEVAEMLGHDEDELNENDKSMSEEKEIEEKEEEGATALPMYLIIAALLILSFVARLVYYERKK